MSDMQRLICRSYFEACGISIAAKQGNKNKQEDTRVHTDHLANFTEFIMNVSSMSFSCQVVMTIESHVFFCKRRVQSYIHALFTLFFVGTSPHRGLIRQNMTSVGYKMLIKINL